MGSSDPVLNLLKDFRYNVVRLPRTNIKPLQILQKEGNDLIFLGNASNLFTAGATPPPQISPDDPAGFINGQRSRDLKISVGLNILGGIIGAMGGSKLGLTAKYNQASTASFEFADVQVNNINTIELTQYLTGAKINANVGPPAQLLEADKLYIITSTVKSKKFTMEAKKSSGEALDVDVPVIQQAVGGSVGVSKASSSSSKVTYEGPTPLVFGFQAIRLIFDKGVFKTFEQFKADAGALKGLDDDESGGDEDGTLQTDGPFANLFIDSEDE